MRWFPWILVLLAGSGCTQPPPPVYLSKDGIGSAEETTRYYQAMTDHPPEPTLADWKKSRCFPAEDDATDPLKAFYYNPSDLGLGREMRCAKCPDTAKPPQIPGLISCAVSNHGPADGPTLGIATIARLKALGAPDAVVSDEKRQEIRKDVIRESLQILDNFLSQPAGAKKFFRGQTVVMDFDPHRADPNEKVRFYIYDAENPKALIAPNTVPTGLIPGLQLDNEGVKFIRNCTYCHGGVFDPQTNKILGSSFLDFNLGTLNYGDSPELLNRDETGFAKKTQFSPDNKNRLAALNDLILNKTTLAPMIADRIAKSTYVVKGTRQGVESDPPYVPIGWQGKKEEEELFTTAVLPYCATCHFSQSVLFNLRPLAEKSVPLTFASAEQWFRPDIQQAIQQSVCGSGDMPHAEVTRLNLLADPVAFGKICPKVR